MQGSVVPRAAMRRTTMDILLKTPPPARLFPGQGLTFTGVVERQPLPLASLASICSVIARPLDGAFAMTRRPLRLSLTCAVLAPCLMLNRVLPSVLPWLRRRATPLQRFVPAHLS